MRRQKNRQQGLARKRRYGASHFVAPSVVEGIVQCDPLGVIAVPPFVGYREVAATVMLMRKTKKLLARIAMSEIGMLLDRGEEPLVYGFRFLGACSRSDAKVLAACRR